MDQMLVDKINSIIEISTLLLEKISTFDFDTASNSKVQNLNAEQNNTQINIEILKDIKTRDEQIQQLFSQFSTEQLEAHREQLTEIYNLDKQLTAQTSHYQHSLKNDVLSMQKNKKAISAYQNP